MRKDREAPHRFQLAVDHAGASVLRCFSSAPRGRWCSGRFSAGEGILFVSVRDAKTCD